MILSGPAFAVQWQDLQQPRVGSTEGSNGWLFPVVSGRDVVKCDPGVCFRKGRRVQWLQASRFLQERLTLWLPALEDLVGFQEAAA